MAQVTSVNCAMRMAWPAATSQATWTQWHQRHPFPQLSPPSIARGQALPSRKNEYFPISKNAHSPPNFNFIPSWDPKIKIEIWVGIEKIFIPFPFHRPIPLWNMLCEFVDIFWANSGQCCERPNYLEEACFFHRNTWLLTTRVTCQDPMRLPGGAFSSCIYKGHVYVLNVCIYINTFKYVGFRNSGCSVEFKVLPGTQAIEHVENRWTCTYPKKAIFFRFSLWFFLPFPNRCVKFVCVFLISLVVDSRPRTCTVTHVFLFGNIKNVQTHYQGKTWMQSKFLKFCPTSLNFATLPVIFQRLGIFFTSSQIPYMTTFLKFRHYIQHPSLVPTTNL